MHCLIVGDLARLGAALGAALRSRHHSVTIAMHASLLQNEQRRALQWWRALGGGASFSTFHDGNALRVLAREASKAGAILSVGLLGNPSADLEQMMLAADAALHTRCGIPLVRFTSISPDSGGSTAGLQIRNDVAAARDFTDGIPTERTAFALDEADRAFRLFLTMRDAAGAVVRVPEVLAAGRFQFDPAEIIPNLVLKYTHTPVSGEDTEVHPASIADVLDAHCLATGVEAVLAGMKNPCEPLVHITGGPRARVTASQASAILDECNYTHGVGRPHLELISNAAALRMHTLTTAGGRLARSFASTDPRHTIGRFYQYIRRHQNLFVSQGSLATAL